MWSDWPSLTAHALRPDSALRASGACRPNVALRPDGTDTAQKTLWASLTLGANRPSLAAHALRPDGADSAWETLGANATLRSGIARHTLDALWPSLAMRPANDTERQRAPVGERQHEFAGLIDRSCRQPCAISPALAIATIGTALAWQPYHLRCSVRALQRRHAERQRIVQCLRKIGQRDAFWDERRNITRH